METEPKVFTGGARVGSMNATWPFAKLRIEDGILNLNVSLGSSLYFSREDIISIEPYSGMISKGIKIVHKVKNYKNEVIFWFLGSYDDLSDTIDTFLKQESALIDRPLLKLKQSLGGQVVKKQAKYIMVAILLPLLLLKVYSFYKSVILNLGTRNIYFALAHNLVFIYVISLCCGVIYSKKIRRTIFINEIEEEVDNSAIFFLMLICLGIFIAHFIGEVER